MVSVDKKNFKVLKLPTHCDERGALTVADEFQLPFKIVRSYWIYGADEQVRGGHRHKKTRQALIAINGKITIYLNDGIASTNISLEKPDQCLIVEPKDWHTMTFERDSILLVLSSHIYDKDEYIHEAY
jgi:dTDP-4-dehydrorhamnose 3,5-epimerase-like enzyme